MAPRPPILVALNAFKGTLTNREACSIVGETLTKLGYPNTQLPIGDGGAGTVHAVHSQLGGEFLSVKASSPLGEKVSAEILCLPNAQKPVSVYLESSQVCGYTLVPHTRKNALAASSSGLGELILYAAQEWQSSLKEIYVGLGDSAVSDAGAGMLSVLGVLKKPKSPPWQNVQFTVLCDVNNPLCGPNGSARVFSPQKGASLEDVLIIEKRMEEFASLVKKEFGKEVAHMPYTGSAGGLSAALYGCLGAKLVPGAEFLFGWIHFDSVLQKHEILITGEGKTDRETLSGKTPFQCLKRAQALGKKLYIISGALGEGAEEISKLPQVAHLVACGDKPTAQQALAETVTRLFSQ